MTRALTHFRIRLLRWQCTQFDILTGSIEEPADFGANSEFRNGAPWSMKMGTNASPWRYDAGACHAIKIRKHATACDFLRYALTGGNLADFAGRPGSLDSGLSLNSRIEVMSQFWNHTPQQV